jgi:NAD(P)-dependent dehydrogenase (short-subunit alcohol dehydrogenase family)
VAQAVDGLDVVVANAGVANTGTVATSSVDALVRTVDVNLVGTIRTVSATLSHVLASRGHYLLVASAASFAVAPGLAAYVAHRGVTVGTAHPTWVDTDLVRDAREDLPLLEEEIRRLGRSFGRHSVATPRTD